MSKTLFEKEKDLLNSSNYSKWYNKIYCLLESKKLEKYIESDYYEEIKAAVIAGTKTNDDLEAAKEGRGKALSYIINSLSDEAYDLVDDIKSPYVMMKALKAEYDEVKNEDLQRLYSKLNKLKANNHRNVASVLRKIKDIYSKLEEKGCQHDNLEKQRSVYNAMPTDIKRKIIFSTKKKLDTIIEEINDYVAVETFFLKGKNKNNQKESLLNNENQIKIDMMDIDHISTQKEKGKYCHICCVKGPTTEKCFYNLKTKTNKGNRHGKNDDKFKKSKYKKHNKNRYVGNVEKNRNNDYENSGSNTDYSSDKSLKQTNSIERIPESKCKHQIKISDEPENNSEEDKIIPEINELRKLDNKITTWTYDTGCSEHITNDKNILNEYKENKIDMKCANDSICKVEGVGTFEGTINSYPVKLENVYYSRNINKNLISGMKLANIGIVSEIKSDNKEVWLKLKNNISNQTIGKFTTDENNIVRIPIKIVNKSINTVIKEKKGKLSDYSKRIWHRRLGHFYHDNLQKYLNLHNIKEPDYLECQVTKLKRKPHNGNPPVATRIGETIHSDVIGPLTKSIYCKRFILTFIDEFSRKAWIYALEKKSKVPKIIIHFFKYLKNQFNLNIKFF